MGFKDEKINALHLEHGLPVDILSRMVDDMGVVNSHALGIALATRTAVQDGNATANQAEVEKLKLDLQDLEKNAKALHANKQQIAKEMIQIKSRIFQLGGRF